ncbi:hypothetical protein F5Y09DRAFT_345948 [Xylaria sp. FL1042]|nr:hypothetical protein F5Y09DRAFT_345948 [Xylaria sp. FL1042]
MRNGYPNEVPEEYDCFFILLSHAGRFQDRINSFMRLAGAQPSMDTRISFTDSEIKQTEVTFNSPEITGTSSEPNPPPSSEDDSDSDIDSTCAVAGSDDENTGVISRLVLDYFDRRPEVERKIKEIKKMATTDDSSDSIPEWTREDDSLICILKSKDKSWAEIGKILQRRRRQCQKRYRKLTAHARELGITKAELADLYIDKDKAAELAAKESGKDKTDHSTSASASKSKGKGKGKGKKVASSSGSSSGSDNDNNNADTEESEDEEEHWEEVDMVAEHWAQRRYLYDTMYSEMYPDQKVLRPDRFYSESDCRVLAGLEARYRANKWLYIQADFCNATGRMVDGKILKAKFEE